MGRKRIKKIHLKSGPTWVKQKTPSVLVEMIAGACGRIIESEDATTNEKKVTYVLCQRAPKGGLDI